MIKFLSPTEIEEAAEAFLKKYHPEGSLPIPIEEILDLKLGINIIPIPTRILPFTAFCRQLGV